MYWHVWDETCFMRDCHTPVCTMCIRAVSRCYIGRCIIVTSGGAALLHRAVQRRYIGRCSVVTSGGAASLH
ncbi:MAG: hypothetical protein LBD27_01725 [Tannerella sp.]|nr:hypothetical protein [Tannerella sp.]